MKVSAIVSAYFAEKYLEGRVQNILDNAGVETEIMVVCRVNSPEHKLMTSPLFQHAGVITVLDGGFSDDPIPTVYEAWNMAIVHAEGEYITNANSDDRIAPKTYLEMANTLDNEPGHSVVYANVNRVTEIGGAIKGVFEWAEGGLYELMFKGCFLGPMPMWRKSLHNTYGYFDPSFTSAGDYEFWLRLASNGERFYHIRKTLGDHLERQDALEHRSPIRSTWESARAKSKYRSLVEKVTK